MAGAECDDHEQNGEQVGAEAMRNLQPDQPDHGRKPLAVAPRPVGARKARVIPAHHAAQHGLKPDRERGRREERQQPRRTRGGGQGLRGGLKAGQRLRPVSPVYPRLDVKATVDKMIELEMVERVRQDALLGRVPDPNPPTNA